MTVPYSFGAATSAIPLSQLDSNFNTPITLGNTAIQLGNTVTTLNNMTLANVTVSTIASGVANAVVTLNSSGAVTTSSNFVYDSSGNLGLGVAPSAWASGWPALQVGTGVALWSTSDGRTSLGSNIFVGSGPTAKYIGNGFASSYTQLNGVHSWNIAPNNTSGAGASLNPTQAMTLDASGNLGIGSTSPNIGGLTRALTLNTPTGGNYSGVELAGAGTLSARFITNNAAGTYIGSQVSIPLIFETNATEAARIDSSGNLLVNQTTNGATGRVSITTNNGTTGSALAITNTSGTSDYYAAAFYNNGASYSYCGGISVSGTTTTYATSSDYRLKEDVQPMTGAIAKVAALNPVTYKWKADGSAGEGFIAHELQEVVPDCVVGEKDAVDEDGNPKYQGIDTSFLVATLTAAIQEQQALIQTLTERITALEGAK